MNKSRAFPATIVDFASLVLSGQSLAGESGPHMSGKWKQVASDYFQPAVLSNDSNFESGFIKTGHHMEGEKHSDKHGDKHHGMKLESNEDIVDTAISTGTFNTLVTAFKAAGLEDTLKGDGPFTVFAPTDEAFAKLPKEKLNALLKDKDALTKVLTYHVVSGKVLSEKVANMQLAITLEGQSLKINTNNGVRVNNANVIMTDIITTNGVIHVVDTVILPPDMMASL